jgi:hypothetical protein
MGVRRRSPMDFEGSSAPTCTTMPPGLLAAGAIASRAPAVGGMAASASAPSSVSVATAEHGNGHSEGHGQSHSGDATRESGHHTNTSER